MTTLPVKTNGSKPLLLGLLLLLLLMMGFYMISVMEVPTTSTLTAIQPIQPLVLSDIPTVSDPAMEQLLNNVVVDSYSHALEEHPNSAPRVWECLHKNGPYMQFQIIPGKRYLRICVIDDETIGFQIVDIVGKVAKERTAYIKDGISNIRQLLDWAFKRGYCRFKGAL